MVTLLPGTIAAAQATQRKYGVPASVTLAQYGLESSWGVHMPKGSNNPFGIKATANQPSVAAMTSEVVKGKTIHISQHFRKFNSIDEAFDAHGALLATKSLYYSAMQRWKAGDLNGGIRLMARHYATAPDYASSLITLIHASHLEQYDVLPHLAPASAPDVPPMPQRPPTVAPPPQQAAPAPVPPANWLKTLIDLFLSLFSRK